MSRALTSRPLPRRTVRRHVGSWLISRIARIGFSSVMSRSTTLRSSSIRSMHAADPTLRNVVYSRHVGVADDDVEAAVALGVGVRLVAGVDDRAAAGGRRADALPDVLGALGDRVGGAAGGVQDLAGAGVDLAADEERDQHLGVVAEVVVAAGAVVLVAAVAVAGRVGVVLEQVDGAADRLLGEALLGRLDEALEDPLAGLVVDDELVQRVALRGGVLGVRADVEVQPGAVLQEHVGAAAPADDASEQVAGDLVGAEPALPAERARDAVLVLEAEDPPLHAARLPVPPHPSVSV